MEQKAKKDFSKGKIYMIRCNKTQLIYIGSTTKQYLSQRMGKHKSHYRDWTNKNRAYTTTEQRLKYEKEYNEAHKEEKAEYDKEYRKENKAQIAEQNKVKITCTCGAIISKCKKSRHIKTKKHQTLTDIQ